MRFRRLILGCCLAAAMAAYAGTSAVSDTRVATVRDVWFTTTVTPGGQQYGRTQPESIWGKVGEFTRGKDAKVTMLVIFNDLGSHQISGSRINPSGKANPFKMSVTPITGGTTGWRGVTKSWAVDTLARGKHTVELTVDSRPAGSYSFVIK